MNLREIAAPMVESHKRTKMRGCQREGGPHDLIPMLDVLHMSGHHSVALLEEIGVAPAAFGILDQRDNPVIAAAILSDAYGKSEPVGTELVRGMVTEAFHAGDLSVEELLVAIVMDGESGEVAGCQVRYVYDDKGMPVFAEPVWMDEESLSGAAVEALELAFAHRRRP